MMFDCSSTQPPFSVFSQQAAVLLLSFTPTGTLCLQCSFCLCLYSTRCPPPVCFLPAPSPCISWPHAFIFFLFCSLFGPHNKPFLLYFLLLYLSPTLAFLLRCPFQSLCEFYANHCARIEALRRQLQEEQRGRQVEHTATAGLGWYCSWEIL